MRLLAKEPARSLRSRRRDVGRRAARPSRRAPIRRRRRRRSPSAAAAARLEALPPAQTPRCKLAADRRRGALDGRDSRGDVPCLLVAIAQRWPRDAADRAAPLPLAAATAPRRSRCRRPAPSRRARQATGRRRRLRRGPVTPAGHQAHRPDDRPMARRYETDLGSRRSSSTRSHEDCAAHARYRRWPCRSRSRRARRGARRRPSRRRSRRSRTTSSSPRRSPRSRRIRRSRSTIRRRARSRRR